MNANGAKQAQQKEESGLVNAVSGKGLSLIVFVQMIVAVGTVAFLAQSYEMFDAVFVAWYSDAGKVLTALLLLWIAPLQDVGYILDRMGAIRAQIQYMAPYGLDLLPTLPSMLPYTKKIVDNIEQVGPFIPVCMQPGCKEYMLPIMADLMPDLEVVLPVSDLLKPVMPKLAPHMKDLLPFTKELLPHTEEILCVVEVDGWWKMNPYLDRIVPHIAKIAPHTKVLSKYLPEMLPYIDILTKHIGNMADQMDETVTVMDKLIPLMPLMPAADQAGLLSQKLAFKALPTVVGFVPLSKDTTGRAAQQAAIAHTKLLAKAQELQATLLQRYKLYQSGKSLREVIGLLQSEQPMLLQDRIEDSSEVEEEKDSDDHSADTTETVSTAQAVKTSA